MVELRREESRSPAQDLIGPLSFGQLGPKPAVLCLKIDRFCWRATTRGFVLTHPHPQGLFVDTKLSCHTTDRAEAEIERTYQRNSLTQTQAEHVRKVLNDVFDQLEGSSEDERKLLTTQRDKLEAERLKLVQAPYADAIPLDLLVDLNDLYSKREPAKRRTLNRALFTRITIDDEENATYTPEQTTAKVLAHTSIDAPAHITAETKLPRHQAGRVSVFSSSVDLAGGLSKLAPPVIQMLRAHQSIRARKHKTHRRRHQPQQAPRASADLLQRAEAAYVAGGSLKAVARQVGLGHERLSRLLREGGVVLRNHSPSISEIRLMRSMYEQGASLERVGNKFGYTAGTVRKHLIAAGVMMRDTHGRV